MIAYNVFHKEWLYVFDSSCQAKVYQTSVKDQDFSDIKVSPENVLNISSAHQFAVKARKLFDECKPILRGDNWHWREVEMKVLTTKVMSIDKSKLGLSYDEFQKLTARLRLKRAELEFISYSKFCLFIGEAVHDRFNDESEANDLGDTISRAADIYMT